MHQIITLFLVSLCYTTNFATSCTIPFISVDNLIFVEGNIDGKSGYFLIDTGSPELVLNEKYFEGFPALFSDVMHDVNGNLAVPKEYRVKNLELTGWEKTRILAKVLDLKHLEVSKKIPIHGIIGYSVFSKFELIFDYEKGQLIINKLDKKGNRFSQNYFQKNPPTDSLDLKMTRHFAFINGALNRKKVRLVIDSGSEINLIEKNLFRGRNDLLNYGKPVFVRGFSNLRKRVATAKVKNLKINNIETKNTAFALTNMSVFHVKGSVAFNGILGAEFLSQYKVAINYRQKKMYVWKDENQLPATKISEVVAK